jgi:hypothetical protein
MAVVDIYIYIFITYMGKKLTNTSTCIGINIVHVLGGLGVHRLFEFRHGVRIRKITLIQWGYIIRNGDGHELKQFS